jgi:hypothetical protein
MATQALTIVCAWCNRVITAAPSGTPVTHTICPTCVEWALAHPTLGDIESPADSHHAHPPAGYFGNQFRR